MNLLPLLLRWPLCAVLSLALKGISPAQQALTPPSRLVLPDNIAVAGTTSSVPTGGINIRQWAYVVWLPTDPAWMARHDVAVYLKPGLTNSPSAFVKQSIVSWTDDAATLAARAQRAETLAGTNKVQAMADVDMILGGLLTQLQQRAGQTDPLPADRTARLAMLIRRTQASETDAATVRALGAAHPLFRMAMGQAWAGDLGVAAGADATLELREVNPLTGAEGGVIGRVTLRAAAPQVLDAPGPPLYVPASFLTIPGATFPPPAAPLNFTEGTLNVPESGGKNDLAMPLRWGIPAGLRRQALLSTGFVVWRLNASYTAQPTAADLINWETNGTNGARRLTTSVALPSGPGQPVGRRSFSRSPVLASKLFTPAGSGDPGPAVENFTEDPDTFFVSDDNDRYQYNAETGKITGTPHAEGQSYKYFVAALDLLGRPGLLSTSVTAIACRTVPPPVPDVIDVQAIPSGSSQALRLRWKSAPAPASAVPANGLTTSTTHYLIQRDRLKNTPPADNALRRATVRAEQSGLYTLALIPQSTGDLTWTDPMVPNTDDYGATYFYTIRALHHGPYGYVASAPSPPVFGTFRDRTGPPQPTGGILTACPRTGLAYTGESATPLPGGSTSSRVPLRIRVTRRDPGVKSVTIGFSYEPIGTEGAVFPPINLIYGDGNVVWRDVEIPLSGELSGLPANQTARIFVRALGTASSRSHDENQDLLLYSRPGLPLFVSGNQYVREFTAGTGTPAPDDDTLPDIWERHLPGPPQSFVPQEQLGGTIGGTWSGISFGPDRTLVIQANRSGWQDVSTARLASGSTSFFFQGENGIYRAWEIVDPPGSPTGFNCLHDPFASQKVEPIRISLTLSTGTKDYRLYRKLDEESLVLLSQGAGDFTNPASLTLIKEDTFMPPNGGTLRYYGQVFDEHGNPSALTLLGERIVTLPDLPIPVLEPPTSFVDGAGVTFMQVRASCPRPGVDRLVFDIIPAPESHTLVAKPLAGENFVFQAPGGSSAVSANAIQNLLQGPLQSQTLTTPIVQTASFRIKADKEYQIKVRSVNDDGKTSDPSPTQAFLYSPPLTAGNVAWPSRPLPAVRTRPLIAPVLATAGNAAPMNSPVDPETFPVGIRIGQVPLIAGQYRSDRGILSAAAQTAFDAAGLLSFFGTRGSSNWDSYLFSLESSYPGAGVVRALPAVLYRQQVRAYSGVVNGFAGQDTAASDTIQVSPLIKTLSTTTSSISGTAFTYLTDADVGLLSNAGGAKVDIMLWDTNPVAEGATYHYYLVRFNPEGEMDQIIDAGEITIPES